MKDELRALEADNARLLGENQELRRENMALRDKIRKLEDDLAEEVRKARLNAFQERHAASQARQEAAWLRRQNEWLNSGLEAALCRLQDLQTENARLREELARSGDIVHIDGVDYGVPATVAKHLRKLEKEAVHISVDSSCPVVVADDLVLAAMDEEDDGR